jgi:hypothetical protein
MTAADQLVEYAKLADPFRGAPDDLAELQLAAIRERFAERRQQIRTLDKRATETGITEIRTLDDVVPLLFAHTNYKSYPEAFIDAGQWKHMNVWLKTLCTYPTDDIDVAGVRDVDDWLDRAHAAGHYLFASSGTSGKSSFLDQSRKDRDYAVPACLAAFDLSTPGYRPNHDRSVFTMMPPRGTHKMTEVSNLHFGRWAAPGELYRLSEEPILAMDSMRPAQLRRMLAAGKVGPGEIAAYEDQVIARQQRRAEAMEAWLDALIARRHQPLYIGLMWGVAWQVVEKLRARGIKDGDFHPDTIMSTGGGTKGAVLPDDYRAQVMRFFGLTEDRLPNSYAMVEMSGFCALIQPHGVFAIPPWIVPLILDKAGERLLNPIDGKGVVEGRMAFFDILADARWGGIISGDKVQVEFGSGLDGVKTPIVRSVARYQDLAEGEDKLTCAGSIDSYVRGAIAA